MRVDRRGLLAGIAATALAGPVLAQPAGLRRLRLGFGFRASNTAVINLLIGEPLGYNKEEGFTLLARPMGTNAAVQIALDKGERDFGISVPSFQLPLYAKGELPPIVNFYEYTYPYKWDIVVPPDSGIRGYDQLKGKKVGVTNFGLTDYPVTRAVLKSRGIDPDKDVAWVAVGEGIPAGIALQRGVVDALASYDTAFGQLEGAGMAIRFLPRPADIPMIGGLHLSCLAKTLKDDRRFALGLCRSAAKATEFVLANPRAGVRLFLQMFPDAAPRGVSEDDAIKSLMWGVNRRKELFRPPYPDTRFGQIRGEELMLEAQFMELPIKSIDSLYSNDLIEEANAFDHEKIRSDAKAA